MKRCEFPAPTFKSVELPNGNWIHVPWDSVLCDDGIYRVPPDTAPRERAEYTRTVLSRAEQ